MTIHKLNPDKANAESRPFTAGISFNHDLSDIGEAVFKTRAIQAFEDVAAWYPIHRLVRCAARRKLEDVFDDLALGVGLTAQRLDTGTLLLDGPGVFVHADGWLKAGYSSCRFNIWGDSKARVEDMRATLLRVVGDRHLPEDTFVLDWQFCNSRGILTSTSFEEISDPDLYDEATTNLPNVRDIDDALLRPGRCFATVCTRFLTQDEARPLLVRLCGTDSGVLNAASAALSQRGKSNSVADVYRAWSDCARA